MPLYLKLKESVYIKPDLRLLDKVSSKHNWATGDAGNVVDWEHLQTRQSWCLLQVPIT